MAIEIFEIETFELPDKNKTVIEIIPIPTEDMDSVLQFMDLAHTAEKLKIKEEKARKTKKGTEDLNNPSIKFTFEKLAPAADKVIDKGTRIQGKTEEVGLFETKHDVEIDGIVYADIEVPIMELRDGKAIQKTIQKPIPFPDEYRTIANRLEVSMKILNISMGDTNALGDNPLLQKLADKSKE